MKREPYWIASDVAAELGIGKPQLRAITAALGLTVCDHRICRYTRAHLPAIETRAKLMTRYRINATAAHAIALELETANAKPPAPEDAALERATQRQAHLERRAAIAAA